MKLCLRYVTERMFVCNVCKYLCLYMYFTSVCINGFAYVFAVFAVFACMYAQCSQCRTCDMCVYVHVCKHCFVFDLNLICICNYLSCICICVCICICHLYCNVYCIVLLLYCIVWFSFVWYGMAWYVVCMCVCE